MRPHLAFAVSVDDVLVAAFGILIAQIQHLAECVHGRGIVFLLAIHNSQALDEDGAIVAIRLVVVVVGFLGFLHQVLQKFHGVVITALRLIDAGHAVRDFKGFGNHGVGLLKVLEGLIVLSLTAINFGDAQESLCVLGIRVGDDFVLLESGVGLTVVEQVFGKAADRIQIVAVEHDRLFEGLNRVLEFLALFVRLT